MPDILPNVPISTGQKPPVSFWRKLGGGSLTISIIVHSVILILGVFWIFQIIPQKDQAVDFMPKGGGGGQVGAKSETNMKKRATMTTMNAPRLAAKGVTSTFSLPEPDPASATSSVGALGSSGMAAGLGGSGSGGGKGNGKGKGFGDGMGPGLGGKGPGNNPFGMIAGKGEELGMLGALYDIKQTRQRKDTGIQPGGMPGVIRKFVEGNWRDSELHEYFQATTKLYQTKVYIPRMPADNAPAAFNCAAEVKPSRWIIVYRGRVSPPRSGKFRFVGAADDVLVVRFNHKNVLDHGFTSGTTGLSMMNAHTREVMTGKANDPGVAKNFDKVYPTKLPMTFYTYSNTSGLNKAIGGFAVGSQFDVRAGNQYDMEILISEIPGGSFGACLLIEEEGVEYQHDPTTHSPILPIFRLDDKLPAPGGEAPPFAPDSPVWKLVTGHNTLDI